MKQVVCFAIFFLTLNFHGISQHWNEILKSVASDRDELSDGRSNLDQFGVSVDVDGEYAVVGAHNEDQDATGNVNLNNAGAAYVFHLLDGTWKLQQKLVHSDRAVSDNFGYRVAIRGEYIAVGAPNEDENAVGGSTQTDAGSVYVFKLTNGTWTEQQKIVASDRGATDQFGSSLDMDTDILIVGAYKEDENVAGSATLSDAGSAYIFKQSGSVWTQQQKIVAGDRAALDFFGYSVAMHGDYAIVGAYQEDENAVGTSTLSTAGSAYIFKQTAGVWAQQQKIVASDRAVTDQFGISVTIEGDYAVIGAINEDQDAVGAGTLTNSGSAYIFKQTAGIWSQQQKIVSSDRANSDNFGCAVAISGNTIAVGAFFEDENALGTATLNNSGSIYVFTESAGNWSQQQKITSNDRGDQDLFGLVISLEGDVLFSGVQNEDENENGLVSINQAGSAYVYNRSASTWTQQQKIIPLQTSIQDFYGYSIAIDGDYAVVGAYQEDEDENAQNTLQSAGAAYVYKRINGNWVEQEKLVAFDRSDNDFFGSAVAISGEYLAIGANSDSKDQNGANEIFGAGSAYIFKRVNDDWVFQQKIVATDRSGNDSFGWTLDMQNEYIVVGAFVDDEDANGASPVSNAGSAYIFKRNGEVWTQQQKIVAPVREVDDVFGHRVAISGNHVIVTAYNEDQDASEGTTLSTSGSAYIYKETNGIWNFHQKLVATDRGSFDYFGVSVDIDNDYAVVGAFNEDHDPSGGSPVGNAGSAYIFKRINDNWVQQQKIVASDRALSDQFGTSVSISGNYILVSADQEDENAHGGNTQSLAGSVYAFRQINGVWMQQEKLVASDRGTDDRFGYFTALSGNNALISAYTDDEDSQGGSPKLNTGSVYFFEASPMTDDYFGGASNVALTNVAFPAGNCFNGSLVGKTVSAEGIPANVLPSGGQDTWYKISIPSTAMRITATSSSMNVVIELHNAGGGLVSFINSNNGTGSEAMTVTSLTKNNVYYIAVRSYDGQLGDYEVCVQVLMQSTCDDGSGIYDLCSNFKASWTGASSYTFYFSPTGFTPGSITSHTAVSQIPLSLNSLGLRHNGTYNVFVYANYNLPEGNFVVPASGACAISIAPHADLRTKESQRCPATVLKGTTLQAKPFICSAINHTITFEEVGDCNGADIGSIPFSVTTSGASSSRSLSSISGVQAGKWYAVQWTPNFLFGAGQPGTTDIIFVAGSASQYDSVSEEIEMDESNHSAVQLFPNPNNGSVVNFTLTDILSEDILIRIMDGTGRLVLSKQINRNEMPNPSIALETKLTHGLYFVEVIFDGVSITEKLLVTN